MPALPALEESSSPFHTENGILHEISAPDKALMQRLHSHRVAHLQSDTGAPSPSSSRGGSPPDGRQPTATRQNLDTGAPALASPSAPPPAMDVASDPAKVEGSGPDISLSSSRDNPDDAPARTKVWGMGSPRSPRPLASTLLSTKVGSDVIREGTTLRQRKKTKSKSPQKPRREDSRPWGDNGLRESTPTTASTAQHEEEARKASPSRSASSSMSSASERWYSRARARKEANESLLDVSESSGGVEQASPL